MELFGIWVSLFTYFLYSWAKDDQTFEVGVAALALFASNIFSIIIPPKKDTFKIEVIDNQSYLFSKIFRQRWLQARGWPILIWTISSL